MNWSGAISPRLWSRFASAPGWAPPPLLRESEGRMKLANFKWDQDQDGIVTLVWDAPDKQVNVLSMAAIAELTQVAEAITKDPAIKGMVLTSGKPGGFSAGADLDEMSAYAGQGGSDAAKAVFDTMMNIHRTFRKIELCGKPVVAAINGTALGGGLEIALACHCRIIADDPRIRLGFPEAQVGLIPGAGGTQRLPRMVGAMQALPLLLEARRIDAATAAGRCRPPAHRCLPSATPCCVKRPMTITPRNASSCRRSMKACSSISTPR